MPSTVKVAIVGEDWIGERLKENISFSNLSAVSNVDSFYSTVEFGSKLDLCFICLNKSLSDSPNYISYLTSVMKTIDSKIFVLTMKLPLGCLQNIGNNYNGSLVVLSFIPRLNSSLYHNLVIGGASEAVVKVDDFLRKNLQKITTSTYTSLEICQSIASLANFWKAALISLTNDFYNVAEALNVDYDSLQKVSNLVFVDLFTMHVVNENARGYFQKDIHDDLKSLSSFMEERSIPPYFVDGIIRGNNFNLRRMKKDQATTEVCEKILFYDVEQPYGYFSNFSEHPIFCNNSIWKTSEHFYQAQKFLGTNIEEEIRLSYTPLKAKAIAKSKKHMRRLNWSEIKDRVMYEALYAKFTQHRDLRMKLLATGEKELCEHSSDDFYWADGGNGSGKNILGKLLMKVRTNLTHKM